MHFLGVIIVILAYGRQIDGHISSCLLVLSAILGDSKIVVPSHIPASLDSRM